MKLKFLLAFQLFVFSADRQGGSTVDCPLESQMPMIEAEGGKKFLYILYIFAVIHTHLQKICNRDIHFRVKDFDNDQILID